MTVRLQIHNPKHPDEVLALVDFFAPHVVPNSPSRFIVLGECVRAVAQMVVPRFGPKDGRGQRLVYDRKADTWDWPPGSPGPAEDDKGTRTYCTWHIELWGLGNIVLGRYKAPEPDEEWAYFVATETMGIRWSTSQAYYFVDKDIVMPPPHEPGTFSRIPTRAYLSKWMGAGP